MSKYLDAKLVENLNFTGDATYKAGNKYNLNDSTSACIVYTKDNWFKKCLFTVAQFSQ